MVGREAERNHINGMMRSAMNHNRMVRPSSRNTIKEHLQVKRYIKKLGGYDLLVGVPAEKDARNDGEPITNAELAYIHTHGVDRPAVRNHIRNLRAASNQPYAQARNTAQNLYRASMGSPAHGIPPRPIIEPAITANKEEINKRLKTIMDLFLSGEESKGEEKLRSLGMFAQNKVRAWFTDPRNGWAPLSPATKKAKSKGGKSKDNPLIDTGELRKSITYVVITPQGDSYTPTTTTTITNNR